MSRPNSKLPSTRPVSNAPVNRYTTVDPENQEILKLKATIGTLQYQNQLQQERIAIQNRIIRDLQNQLSLQQTNQAQDTKKRWFK